MVNKIYRCGEVWDTRCAAFVGAPTYSHGPHPGVLSRQRIVGRSAILAVDGGRPVSVVSPKARVVRADITVSVLGLLALDRDPAVRQGVAVHMRTPSRVLARLARDPEIYVRRAAAINPNTPGVQLFKLATDADQSVRRAVTQNPQAPGEALGYLVADGSPWVSESARAHPNLPEHLKVILAIGKP